MDATRFPGVRRTLAGALVIGALAAMGSPTEASPYELHGATPRQARVARWAFSRFQAAGLPLPRITVVFHDDPAGCDGNSGFYRESRLDLCTGDKDTPYARKAIVHELAHAWADQNLTLETQVRFLRVRGLETWNDWDQAWGLRGSEQAAEVITSYLGPGLTPLIPGHPTSDELATGYRVLTGSGPPDVWNPAR